MLKSTYQSAKKKIINFSRSPHFQSFWENLLNKSLVGMNYWGGARFLESGELKIIEKLLSKKEEIVFFDVGANDGNFAKQVSLILPGTAKIYCFEPLSNMYRKLCETTGEIENISKFNLGFGAREEISELYSIEGEEALTSLYRDIHQREFTFKEQVKITTIDEFLKVNGISQITYLKIDVEGHELKVLEGAASAIENHKINFIQFEFGESMVAARVFFKDFWSLLSDNYRIFRILPSGLREIENYSERWEIFHCINFLAVSKLHV